MNTSLNLFLSLLYFLLVCPVFAQTEKLHVKISNRKNLLNQQKKPYVLLISIDGFRYDYIEKHGAPFLDSIAGQGVRATYLEPSFPSITFPNHYTLVTGMIPAHHGLVGNTIYDPQRKEFYSMRNAKAVRDSSWYGGKPIWSLAEEQGMLTAAFYWPGSEAKIAGYSPTYSYRYNETIELKDRIQQIKDWLTLSDEERPHLINFYFPQVDKAGHHYGPDSDEAKEAVRWVDSAVRDLYNAVNSTGLDVNFLVVSDHGMTDINPEIIPRPTAIDTANFVMVNNGTYISLFAKDPLSIRSTYEALRKNAKHYRIYLHDEVPKKYRFGGKDDKFNRVGDIVLLAKAPFYFYFGSGKPNPGTHGYHPAEVKDMNSTFVAWGKDFRQGASVKRIKNTEIYPLLIELLELKGPESDIGKTKGNIRKLLRKF